VLCLAVPSPDLKQPVFVLALNDIDEVEIGECAPCLSMLLTAHANVNILCV
jgi:hypothetical protein